MSISHKIKKIRELRGLSVPDLASKMHINRMSIYDWEKGKYEPSKENLSKLADILGVSVKDFFDEKMPIEGDRSQKLIPYYDAYAVGGDSMIAEQNAISEPAEMINPGTWFQSATGALRVYGHSMFPKYPAGCIIAFRRTENPVILWGEDYVIELEDRRIVKRVEKSKLDGHIKAVSYNSGNHDKYAYEPIDIPLSAIRRMYMVLGKIELEASI